VSSTTIFALRKEGRSDEALELARSEYPDHATDVWFLRAYAWVLYDHMKPLVASYEAKASSPATLTRRLTPLMREFAQIAEPLRGDAAFRQMLRLAGKVSKDWIGFLGFARWAGVDGFAEVDRVPFVTAEGKTIDSLQKRFTRAICREVASRIADERTDSELISWGLGILSQALQDEPNDQWLNYYQSKVYLAQGKGELAIGCLASVLRRQIGVAWPWIQLGQILMAARPHNAITCFTHATHLARNEQNVARVRIHLAELLSRAGRLDEAAYQASIALKHRERHGHKIPQELAQLLGSDWYRQAVARGKPQRLPRVDQEANDLLNELDRRILSYTLGVVDHINTQKALTYVTTGADTGFGLPHRRFPGVAHLSPGTFVEVGHARSDGPPLDWRLTDANALPGVCEKFTGTLQRQEDKAFAFVRASVGDVFVPPPLAELFAPGRRFLVNCLAMKRTNKQGRTGWRAVRIGVAENDPAADAT
jgi:tetratricopeptide (TPR) repeat protein